MAAVIAFAYVGCVDNEAMIGFIAATTIRAVKNLECLVDAWGKIVTPEAIASSLAYGNGLDDVPTDIADQMTLTTAACVTDRQWWIDDEARRLEARGWEPDQATCAATTVVDTLGVTPIIRSRVLTVPSYPVPRTELERVDFLGRCDLHLGGRQQLGIPGTCLTGFGSGTSTEQIGCDQSHNAEIVAVADLGAEYPTWPGAQQLREIALERCVAAVEALPGDTSEYGAGWDIPNRLAWEQSHRVLTCTLVRGDYSNWTGPSGLAPTNQPTLVDLNSLTVGQCLLGAELIDGYIEDVVEVVDSATPHHAEVFHVSQLEDPAGTPYPGDTQTENSALARCHPSFDNYVGRKWVDSRLGFTYVFPYQHEWEANNRLILCYLWDRLGRTLTGSMAGSGQ